VARSRRVICIAGLPALAISSRWSITGLKYGLMAAYSEGLNILRHANVGKNSRTAGAETTPLHMPAPAAYPSGLIAACQHDDWAPAPDKRWNTEGLPCEPYSIG